MLNKCSVSGCSTNHATGEKGTVFKLPKDQNLRCKWLFFVNREYDDYQKHIFVCYKHFAEHFVKKNDHLYRFITNLNPYPTVLTNSQSAINASGAEREISTVRLRESCPL